MTIDDEVRMVIRQVEEAIARETLTVAAEATRRLHNRTRKALERYGAVNLTAVDSETRKAYDTNLATLLLCLLFSERAVLNRVEDKIRSSGGAMSHQEMAIELRNLLLPALDGIIQQNRERG